MSFSMLLTISTVDFVGRLTGQVIQIPELTPGAHMREFQSITVGVGQHLNKLGTISRNGFVAPVSADDTVRAQLRL